MSTSSPSSCTIVLKNGEPSSSNGVVTVDNLTQAVPFLPDPLTNVTIVVSTNPTLFQPLQLATALSSLAVSGSVTIEATAESGDDSFNPSLAWVLAGLTPQSETTSGTTRRWTATKLPSAVQAVALKTKSLNTNSSSNDNGGVLINEDDLLQDEGEWAPSLTAATKNVDEDDCGGREPCENCTCGRAEGAMPSQQQQPMATSNCGKCGMGDAFRCASCPFLGKPAFQQGQEHLVLEMQDDF